MAEAQGLSRTVLQPVDILGEQRQAQMQREALDLRKEQAKGKPKAIDFGAANKLGQLPPEFIEADRKMSDAVNKFILDNATDLSNGDPTKTAQLSQFVQNYNMFKNQASQASKLYNDDVDGLPENRRNELGFVGWLMDANDLGENLVIDDNLNMTYKTPEGAKSIFDASVVLSPRNYYYKGVNWLEDATKGAKATMSSIESGDRTVTQADRNKIQTQIRNSINLGMKEDDDAIANMTLSYGKEVLGTQLSPQALKEIIAGGGVEASVEGGGTKIITLDDVIEWGTNRATEQVLSQAGLSIREDDKGGGVNINFGDRASVEKLKGQPSNFDPEDEKEGMFPNVYGLNYSPSDKIKINYKHKGKNTVAANVTKLSRGDDGSYYAEINYAPTRGVAAVNEVIKLNDSQVSNLENELQIGSGNMDRYFDAKMGDFRQTVDSRSGMPDFESRNTQPEPNATEEELQQQTPTISVNSTEELQSIDYEPYGLAKSQQDTFVEIHSKAPQYGVDPNHAARVAMLESSLGADMGDGDAQGLYQFMEDARSDYDVDTSTNEGSLEGFAKMTNSNKEKLTEDLGREPENWELYAAHQQGLKGFTDLATKPNEKAVEVRNFNAIKRNLPANSGLSDAEIRELTSQEFLDLWKQKYESVNLPTVQVGEQSTSEVYVYDGSEYTIEELKQQYGEDFDPNEYEGFELKQ